MSSTPVAPARCSFPADSVPASPLKGYSPPFFGHPCRDGKPWADDESRLVDIKFNEVDDAARLIRTSHRGIYPVDEDTNMPLNPFERTGGAGPWTLGRFGPNHAADPIPLYTAADGGVYACLVRRADNGLYAFAGGFADPEDYVSPLVPKLADTAGSVRSTLLNTAVRELREETGFSKEGLDFFRSNAIPVYEWYVKDARNTDNAWIETTAWLCHDKDGAVFPSIGLKGADDAASAAWVRVSPEVTANMHANHAEILQIAMQKMKISPGYNTLKHK